MKYLTIKMLCAHTGKHRITVLRALKAAQVPVEKAPGCKGLRIPEEAAAQFLQRQWPEVGPLPR